MCNRRSENLELPGSVISFTSRNDDNAAARSRRSRPRGKSSCGPPTRPDHVAAGPEVEALLQIPVEAVRQVSHAKILDRLKALFAQQFGNFTGIEHAEPRLAS